MRLKFEMHVCMGTTGKALRFDAIATAGEPYVVLQDSDGRILSNGSLPLSHTLSTARVGVHACRSYMLIQACSGSTPCAAAGGVAVIGGAQGGPGQAAPREVGLEDGMAPRHNTSSPPLQVPVSPLTAGFARQAGNAALPPSSHSTASAGLHPPGCASTAC